MKFFGETPEEEIEKINKVIRPFAKSLAPFKAGLESVGIFGSRYSPRVIWIGTNDNGHLTELGTRLLLKLDEAGFPDDRQNFVPHLTIGRIKNIDDKSNFQKRISEMKDTYFQTIEVKEIILFESQLRPQGPIYVQLEKYGLNGNIL
jgi:2'-5' RNA ligase